MTLWDKVCFVGYYILAQYIGLLVFIPSMGSTYLKRLKANKETKFGNLRLDLHNISHQGTLIEKISRHMHRYFLRIITLLLKYNEVLLWCLFGVMELVHRCCNIL